MIERGICAPIPEFSRVVLAQDLENGRFKAGDVSTVVHVYQGGKGYELEFFTLSGETIDVVTVDASQVRAVDESYISHARELAGSNATKPDSVIQSF